MKWNNESGVLEYYKSLDLIKNKLGLPAIDFLEDYPPLIPYATYILRYISQRFIELGSDATLKDYVSEVLNIYRGGAERIVYGGTIDLAWELGIDTDDECIKGVEVPYHQDRFVFTWSTVMAGLVTKLRLLYSYLFNQPVTNDCCSCPDSCKGQTTKDFETWTSKVYPEDEEFDYRLVAGNASWDTTFNSPECTKCYQK